MRNDGPLGIVKCSDTTQLWIAIASILLLNYSNSIEKGALEIK